VSRRACGSKRSRRPARADPATAHAVRVPARAR
jgi:hypothetical protein